MAFWGKLGNYRNFGLLIIRVGLGIMFIFHGFPKLKGGPEMWTQIGGSAKYIGIHFLPVVWGFLCALVEAVGGVLIILGLAFRPVCLLMVINLIVAALSQLNQGGLMDASHAIEVCVVFAGLIFVGPGKYSVDKR